MMTSHDAAIAIRGERFADAAKIYKSLGDHASILRKRAKADYYYGLAKETLDLSKPITTGM